MFSSLVGGILADWFGRKRMMVVSGLMFVASVGLIVISQAFLPLFLGRLLQVRFFRPDRPLSPGSLFPS
jgi:MFS transporter, SP family, solute carrier family 2 (myo-inositol transporter), member 13